MNTKRLGNSDVYVSEQIFGAWAIGGTYFLGAEDQTSIETIRTGIEHSVTTIDTAYIYGNGHSEQVVGEAIQGYDREKLTVISKLWYNWMRQDRVEIGADNSLKALGTDYMDVYFIHYPPIKGVTIGETMTAMMKLKDKGKIRAIGVSNFSEEELKEARKYGDVDVIQPCYSLVWRFLDKEELQYCLDNNIGIISYSTLAQGILTGKFTKDTTFPKEDGRAHVPLFQSPYFEGALEVVEQIRPFAEKYGVTPAQFSIRWVIQQKGITAPIVGAKNPKQLLENVKANDFVISEEDFAAVDAISRAYTDTLPRFQTFFHA